MRITSTSEIDGTGRNVAFENAAAPPARKFSQILKEKKLRAGDETRPEEREATVEEQEKVSGREATSPEKVPAGVSAFAPPPLFPHSLGTPSVDGQRLTETRMPEALIAALVQEIAVQSPSGGVRSVEIHFASRTLEGLRVRVQLTGDVIDVRFSTASETVSRLLTANADRLAQALAHRGFMAPSVVVQHTFSNREKPALHGRHRRR